MKDLQRCTASLTRYRMVVKEEMDSSIKRMKQTFAELQSWYVHVFLKICLWSRLQLNLHHRNRPTGTRTSLKNSWTKPDFQPKEPETKFISHMKAPDVENVLGGGDTFWWFKNFRHQVCYHQLNKQRQHSCFNLCTTSLTKQRSTVEPILEWSSDISCFLVY